MSDLKRLVNEAVASGRMVVDYDPLRLLKELQLRIGYCDGYLIRISDDMRMRIHETIAFHEGGELYGRKPHA